MKKLKYLRELLEFLEYHNRMSPFPMYDTEYVRNIQQQLEIMEKEKVNYDKLPTAACRYCDSLGIHNDELENDVCLRCGSVNEINIFSDYYAYELYLTVKLDEDN